MADWYVCSGVSVVGQYGMVAVQERKVKGDEIGELKRGRET